MLDLKGRERLDVTVAHITLLFSLRDTGKGKVRCYCSSDYSAVLS